ncbi:MAG: AGE family epimerase/isomerase [Clostridia bacterium]|nr:AGE family epimerase/isomerase [Clostridia bacterium]
MNYKESLMKDILPFWLGDAIDKKYGGIFTCLDEMGNIYGEEKSVWFQGRALWTFSKAYNVIEKNTAYLEAAKNIYAFLPKCEDTDGRMYFTVTCDGKGIQKRRYYFSETFAAIGCAEYYVASGEKDALLAARKYFDIAYECFTGKRKNEPKFKPETHDFKALSPVMIMLSTAQTMRAIDTERYNFYAKIAKDCVHEIVNGGFLTEKALLENVTADGSFSDTPTGRIVNPGHSMEAAWFLISEGLLTDNEEIVNIGKKVIDITYPLGWDKKHGGIIAFTDVLGKPPVQLEWDMKLWWPQCETIIAARLAYDVFKDEKYLQICRETERYCEKYFVDHANGEWHGYLHYDNTVSNTLKGNIFKGPFHIPRLYMIMASLDRGNSIRDYMLSKN